MDIFKYFKDIIKESVSSLYGLDKQEINLEYPKNIIYGDLSTNIAMLLHKTYLEEDSITIAKKIADKIKNDEFIENINIAGSGFINIKVKKAAWLLFLTSFIDKDLLYPEYGKKVKVNIETVSANPTGPIHIGHARSGILADVIANLMKVFGYQVTKEYYVNDAGAQIKVLANSLYTRYRQILGEDVELDDLEYPGKYLIDIAHQLCYRYKDSLLRYDDSERIELFRVYAVDKILELIKKDLQNLNIDIDVFTSESDIIREGNINKTLDILKEKNLLYEGSLESPKNAKFSRKQNIKKQLIFKSSAHGDDEDRTLIKTDGSYTYFAADAAYHFNKIERDYNYIVLFLGADHIGYEKRIKAAVKLISDDKVKMQVKLSQLVSILENGKTIKMSKRSGKFLSLSDVISDIGADALRFALLSKSPNTPISIDIAKLKKHNKDNHIFYVQYACARANSLLRKAKKININHNSLNIKNLDLKSLLSEEIELNIIKFLALFPKILFTSLNSLDPHKITYYLYELACLFHKLWSSIELVSENDVEYTKAKLLLVKAVLKQLQFGLGILGIKAVDKM